MILKICKWVDLYQTLLNLVKISALTLLMILLYYPFGTMAS